MEVIELNHEICYRSLNELLNDLCPRSSLVAVSSVRIDSSKTAINPDLAILSNHKLIIVQDIQNAIDYISVENLRIIEVDQINHIALYGRLIALELNDEPDVTIAESKLDSKLPLELGFDTTFSTFANALEELVIPTEPRTIQESSIEEAPAPIPVPVDTPLATASHAPTVKEEEEEPRQSRKWLWLVLPLLLLVCAILYLFTWSGANEVPQRTEPPVVIEAPVLEAISTKSVATLTASTEEEELRETESSQTPAINKSSNSRTLKAAQFKETLYGEVWPADWVNTGISSKNVQVIISSKDPMYQIQYSVNGKLIQSPYVIYDRDRSNKLTNESAMSVKVNSYSNPSSDMKVHVDVLNGSLLDIMTESDLSNVELNLSVEAADYAVAFKF